MRRSALVLLLALPLIGAVLGRGAGPFSARAHRTVRLAERISLEDSEALAERTLESEAFRATGKPAAELFAQARAVEGRFRTGTTWFGAWCGLVAAVKLLSLLRVPRRDRYEVDQGRCVACGRCFIYCPREKLRLKKLAEQGGS